MADTATATIHEDEEGLGITEPDGEPEADGETDPAEEEGYGRGPEPGTAIGDTSAYDKDGDDGGDGGEPGDDDPEPDEQAELEELRRGVADAEARMEADRAAYRARMAPMRDLGGISPQALQDREEKIQKFYSEALAGNQDAIAKAQAAAEAGQDVDWSSLSVKAPSLPEELQLDPVAQQARTEHMQRIFDLEVNVLGAQEDGLGPISMGEFESVYRSAWQPVVALSKGFTPWEQRLLVKTLNILKTRNPGEFQRLTSGLDGNADALSLHTEYRQMVENGKRTLAENIRKARENEAKEGSVDPELKDAHQNMPKARQRRSAPGKTSKPVQSGRPKSNRKASKEKVQDKTDEAGAAVIGIGELKADYQRHGGMDEDGL